ncbi:MAG: IS91 family transposase [Syntrophus sp. (in: bacteria)]|nr:IS91 family transposase [Syntrophus sp. (in: bacteria)]
MGKATLQDIMKTAYKAYESTHLLPLCVRRAAEALIKCRTAELGGHMQACPEGHYQRQWYNSCRHRSCPQCNWIRIEQWLEKQKKRVLACPHYHMIFTIPHELNDLWLQNVKAMTNLLFTCVRDTLFEFCLDKKHIGGKPGIIATLHTWGQTLILHPHIHCLITEGGLLDSLWRETRQKGYLLPIEAVMMVFRGKFLDYLHKAIIKGTIILPPGMTLTRWKSLRYKLHKKNWSVHIKARHEAESILLYLARYIRGGAISNRRIISFADNQVVFSYKNSNRTKKETMPLTAHDFIKRYLLHVPAPFTKVVRYYGLYAPSAHKELTFCRTLFNQDVLEEPEYLDWQSYCEKKGDDHPERCPVCGSRLIRMMDIPRVPRFHDREAISDAA